MNATTNPEIIGVYSVSNSAAIAIYELDPRGEYVVAGMVVYDGKAATPRRYKLYQRDKGTYFKYRGTHIYLHEIMRTSYFTDIS